MAVIIDGKHVAKITQEKIASDVKDFYNEHGIIPTLAVIVVGDDPASAVYVRNKSRACDAVGINASEIRFSKDISEDLILREIDRLNKDVSVNGILVQLPLPQHISEIRVANRIDPKKDVDAFSFENVGRIALASYSFLPCTPSGIIRLLEYYNIEISGKRCVVVGRSNIVGKPMAMLLLEKNGTVTVCHSRTQDLFDITKEADILIAAIGKPAYITEEAVKRGATVIDVGINRDQNGKLVGDVDFDSVSKVASYITPVPGGVGPMTVTMLLENTLNAAKIQSCGI